MPRANRVFIPGHVWHITQRCHQREFLLKARIDRRRWLYWLFEAQRRYGLCVLNYIVTCNHIHLLVRDQRNGEIAAAMRLVAGRTGQEHNDRRKRSGAFWQDRYHATAVASDGHLLRCMSYIDLNMVRAGVVAHPFEWPESGYCELQRLPQRYRIIDTAALCALVGCQSPEALRRRARAWTERVLGESAPVRQPEWTESVAVGSKRFLRTVKGDLGPRAVSRAIDEAWGVSCLREAPPDYSSATGRRHPAGRADD
ncbi:transposase [Wenzhouxiangella sp. XN24]|uniref:transposase n=1 Tax=Wenzhouxiangella sp. XN24 TaxID=2713569 RepID=UPI001F11798F|nr:transposase [Wenzhouxiangella sp. XN24]